MNKNIISSFVLIMLVSACSGKKFDYVVVDYSSSKKPIWIQDIGKYENKKENDRDKYKYFESDGESISRRLCERAAIVNTNITIASEINNRVDDLYTGLNEVQMEELLKSDDKKEEMNSHIQDSLVGVELRDSYWEKRKYSIELGADKDKTIYYCYQLSRVKRSDHDKIIKEALDKQLENIKNGEVKQEIEKTIESNAEKENVNIK
jgi:hypothetical protein